MQQRIFGWPVKDPAGGDYGVRLDQISPADFASRIEGQFERYRETQAEDWAWTEEKIRTSGSIVKMGNGE
jgi:hypothetical protein